MLSIGACSLEVNFRIVEIGGPAPGGDRKDIFNHDGCDPLSCVECGAAEMRSYHHVRQGNKAWLDPGLMLVNIKPGTRNPFLFQRLHQSLFIHNGTSSRVDEISGGAHETKLSIAEQVDGVTAKRGVNRDEVRFS